MCALNYLDYYSLFFPFGFYYYFNYYDYYFDFPFGLNYYDCYFDFPFGLYYYDFSMYKPATDRKLRFILDEAIKRGIEIMVSKRDSDSVLRWI